MEGGTLQVYDALGCCVSIPEPPKYPTQWPLYPKMKGYMGCSFGYFLCFGRLCFYMAVSCKFGSFFGWHILIG